jgi:uncharacterized protein
MTMSNADHSSAVPAPARPGGVLSRARWSPYLVGLGIGLLSILAFAIVDRPIGMSTQVSQASGACMLPIIGEQGVRANAYWARHTPKWDYGMLFAVGTIAGALLSSVVSRSFRLEAVPTVWRERFGPGVGRRMLVAFIGAAVMLFGARMAGGCTSGHGISGSLQLALSSWTFFLTMFAAGVITALLVFGRGRASN